MSARRPWKVHVHSIGPDFSYGSEEAALAQAARLVSGETWDGGRRGLLGSYGTVTVHVSESERADPDPDVLIRRWRFVAGEGLVAVEIFRRGVYLWEPAIAALRVVEVGCAKCGEVGLPTVGHEPCPGRIENLPERLALDRPRAYSTRYQYDDLRRER